MPRPAVIRLTAPGRIGSAGAETVAMHDFAVEQIGDGGEPDMRVRPHVDAVAGAEHRRSEMIEEDERPDHARARRRQRAMHLEAAEIDRCAARSAAAMASLDGASPNAGSLAGKEAHDAFLRWRGTAAP